ncbi:hypothetical protein QTJ16_000537 [Diplocarpon rosae]|uniref:Uncharacterized protein n=1 Tax=Diplocarpon rosae TaxID=946125 RepID=A0AAD9WFF9_9HELO|nr:hypothetical protein QTJ16_000537 [Diplocarpon rosae]
MRVLPFRTELFAPSTTDRDHKAREPSGRLLSSPLTTTFSRKRIRRSPASPRSRSQAQAEMAGGSRDVACQVSSEELWSRYSVSTAASDDDWLMEDIFGPDESRALATSPSSDGSSASPLDDEEQLWRRYESVSPFYQNTPTPIQAREQAHYRISRRSPAPPQLLDAARVTQLARSQTIRSPRRPKLAEAPWSPSPTPTPTPTPLPASQATTPESEPEAHTRYHSWPLPDVPLQPKPRLRARANTAPATRPTPPLDHYLCSEPSSPLFAPAPSLMDLGTVETSAFSDDEDDDGAPRLCHRVKTVLQLGKTSAPVAGEKLPVARAQRAKPRRSWGGVWHSLLKGKKGATL